jgi:hypothetical protein
MRKPKTTQLAAAPAPTAAKVPAGKLGILVGLLSRPEGALVAEMMAASGWQAHSVRGAIAGALKKKHGLAISSEAAERGRVYRLTSEASA